MKRLGLCALVLLTACQFNNNELTILSSVTNEENSVSATWTESGAGATTNFVYRLHLHKISLSPESTTNNEVLRTNNILDTEVSWSGNNVLAIKCLRGDVYFWINRNIVDSHNIRIELESTCAKPASDKWTFLPPGTAIEEVEQVISRDLRFQNALGPDKKALPVDLALRILHNDKEIKAVIPIPLH